MARTTTHPKPSRHAPADVAAFHAELYNALLASGSSRRSATRALVAYVSAFGSEIHREHLAEVAS